MVKKVIKKVRPTHGFSHSFHLGLVAVIPPLAFILIRLDINTLAILLVILSKWRMFAVQPRHWIAHFRTNAVDVIASLSFVSFMIASSESFGLQLVWLLAFWAWLLYLKPRSSALMVGLQALVSQFVGVTAMFLSFEEAPAIVYIIGAALICYFSARHFFGSYEEPHRIQYSWLWTFFSASLVWILSHWLLFYGPVAQPAVFLTVIGYGLAGLYYLHEHDKLTQMVRRQIIFVVVAVVFVMVALSNWGDGIIK